jgi:hypothetical protein
MILALDLDLGVRRKRLPGLVEPAAVTVEDQSGEDQRLRLAARFGEAALDQQLVQT